MERKLNLIASENININVLRGLKVLNTICYRAGTNDGLLWNIEILTEVYFLSNYSPGRLMTDNYAFGGYMVRKHGWPFDLNGGF